MKNTKVYSWVPLLVVVVLLFASQGCKEKNNLNPVKKLYVWAVGASDSTNRGMILFSNDGGATWTRQGLNCDALIGADVYDVWAVDENTVWVVGSQDLIMKSTNGGQSWTTITPPDQKTNTDLNSISILGKDNVWIASSNGQVFHSGDGGIQWTVMQSPVLANNMLQGIHAVNTTLVYVVGSYKESQKGGFIARTVNGGITWDSIVPSRGLKKYQCIGVKATDANHVIINGGVSHYMVTSDGGQSWQGDSLSKAADFNCLQMLDSQTWWCALDYDNIYITEDAGITWTKQGPLPPPGDMWMLGIDYYNRSMCVAVGSSQFHNEGKIVRTIDGGQTWELVKETSCWLWKVSFIRN